MPKERNGRRKTREQQTKRVPRLGYYFIVTDAQKTEHNYMLGLRDAIPEKMRNKLVIKVSQAKTSNLVNEAIDLISLHPQYGEPWIVFDRDKVPNFDAIIEQALQKGVNVGWSNPCIEIWFSAYWGEMPAYISSVACCSGFGKTFNRKTGHEYQKADPKIYEKLFEHGDEELAIITARRRHSEHGKSGKIVPSSMCPATTVYMLVDEIRKKITQED